MDIGPLEAVFPRPKEINTLMRFANRVFSTKPPVDKPSAKYTERPPTAPTPLRKKQLPPIIPPPAVIQNTPANVISTRQAPLKPVRQNAIAQKKEVADRLAAVLPNIIKGDPILPEDELVKLLASA